jgi:hypothetical protein
MTPLDDFPPAVRQSVVRLRAMDLDMETLEAMAEVMVAVVLPKLIVAVEAKVQEAVKKRDAQWKAKLTRARRWWR